jgi:hypothetical protein
LLERHHALHHHVEVVVWEIIEEYTDFWRWLLERKKVVTDGLDSYRHQR